MTERRDPDPLRRRIGLGVTFGIGVVGVLTGVLARDPWTVGAAVLFVVVMLLVLGPLLAWQRRGDGPYDVHGPADDARRRYVRLRYPGDHQGG